MINNILTLDSYKILVDDKNPNLVHVQTKNGQTINVRIGLFEKMLDNLYDKLQEEVE